MSVDIVIWLWAFVIMMILYGVVWGSIPPNIETPESSSVTIPTALARVSALMITICVVLMLGTGRYCVGTMPGNIAQNDQF